MDAERGEVFLHRAHHCVDGEIADGVEPEFGRGDLAVRCGECRTVDARQFLADRNEIVAAVLQAAGDFLAELCFRQLGADRLQVAP